MDSQVISLRIPDRLLEKIDRVAQERYPQKNDKRPNRSQVILDAIERLGESEKSDKYSQLEERIKNLEQWRESQTKQKATPKLERIIPNSAQANKNQQMNEVTNAELTNAELARLLKLSPSTISRWANGKRQSPDDLAYRFDPLSKLWKKSY